MTAWRGVVLEAMAGQVPSDAPWLVHFYQRSFRKQDAFPVFERNLQ